MGSLFFSKPNLTNSFTRLDFLLETERLKNQILTVKVNIIKILNYILFEVNIWLFFVS